MCCFPLGWGCLPGSPAALGCLCHLPAAQGRGSRVPATSAHRQEEGVPPDAPRSAPSSAAVPGEPWRPQERRGGGEGGRSRPGSRGRWHKGQAQGCGPLSRVVYSEKGQQDAGPAAGAGEGAPQRGRRGTGGAAAPRPRGAGGPAGLCDS